MEEYVRALPGLKSVADGVYVGHDESQYGLWGANAPRAYFSSASPAFIAASCSSRSFLKLAR